jgi:hypothetical protein
VISLLSVSINVYMPKPVTATVDYWSEFLPTNPEVRGSLRLVSTIEELFEIKSSGSSL